MVIALNGTVTMYSNLLNDIQIAKQTGYDAVEIIGSKLYRYLDQGFTFDDLLPYLKETPAVALGYVQDIERQEPKEYEALLQETEKMCSVAEKLDCRNVEILTGPIGPGFNDFSGYMGLWDRPWPEVRDVTVRNLKAIADIGKCHNVRFYFEPLCWTPASKLSQVIEMIDAAERDNVGIVIDFWHQFNCGTTPDDVAKLDKKLIVGVHFCDSLPHPGGVVQHKLREVWTGGGIIPLKEWVDAVISTGFDGWWAPELFSPRHWELNPMENARSLRDLLIHMLI